MCRLRETVAKRKFFVKIVGSIARNARFGSLFCEIWKKPRTKRSFWKLFLAKLSEASCETLVLEACSVKFGGSLARNDHFGSFGSFCSTGVVRSSTGRTSFCRCFRGRSSAL